jgi:hypothetical protein
MTFSDHPIPPEKAGEGGFLQGEIDRSSVGTGAGITGLLPVVEKLLHLSCAEGRAIPDGATTGDGYLRRLQIAA